MAIVGLVSATVGGIVVHFVFDRPQQSVAQTTASSGDSDHGHEGEHDEEEDGATIRLSKEMWAAARLKVEPAERRSMDLGTWATGKVTLNDDRTAHIYSITEGRAHEVPVSLGDKVQFGQVLAIIDSREVGSAKLELYQARLQEEFARKTNDFAQRVKTNASELIEALSSKKSPAEIDAQLGDKAIGKYREQLLGAYAELIRSRADYERLESVASSGAVAGKQFIAAEASYRVAEANFDSVMEQLRFSIPQDALQAEQSLRQAMQSVDVAKAKLSILGYSNAQLDELKPGETGEQLSHYEVRAPFAGTIIAKNAVLGERVGTDTEMFQISDLSTVWVQADIYQKDLPTIQNLKETFLFRAPTGSDGSMHTHQATIFYRGEVIDPNTRTLRLRAIIDNRDGHIKPGMFVEIEIPGESSGDMLVVPESAVQVLRGRQVVFVQGDDETSFRVAPIVAGRSGGGFVSVQQGLDVGDRVVTSGAFALKSEMMKGEISHGH